MAAGTYDLTVEQGATLNVLITWKDAAGVPVNLTGYSARAQIRSANLKDLVIDLDSSGHGITFENVTSPSTYPGKVRIIVAAADTLDFDFETGAWSLELTSGGGVVTRLLDGEVLLAERVIADVE